MKTMKVEEDVRVGLYSEYYMLISRSVSIVCRTGPLLGRGRRTRSVTMFAPYSQCFAPICTCAWL